MKKPNLSLSLKSVLKDKKVFVLIDGANLYHAAHQAKINIDFPTLYSWFKDNSRLEKIIYYTAHNPEDEKQQTFISTLEETGYEIVKKPIKVFATQTKGNLDVELTVDAILNLEKYDILVLLSGDGDFTYLLQKLYTFNKKVVVLGVGGFVSYELHQEADSYYFLDRVRNIWQARKKPKNKKAEENTEVKLPEIKMENGGGINNLPQKVIKTKPAPKAAENSSNELVSGAKVASIHKPKVMLTPQPATEYSSTNKQVKKSESIFNRMKKTFPVTKILSNLFGSKGEKLNQKKQNLPPKVTQVTPPPQETKTLNSPKKPFQHKKVASKFHPKNSTPKEFKSSSPSIHLED